MRIFSFLIVGFCIAAVAPATAQQKKRGGHTPDNTTATTGAGQPPYLPPWNFMSLSTGSVDTFLLEHPTYDGRGVLVLIFDTGVDMAIPGLERTSTGEPKVIDAIDFSESNVIRFTKAAITTDSTGSRVLRAPEVPVQLSGFQSLAQQAADTAWYIGVMDESRYKNSSVRDFDGDGESETMFGALLIHTRDGWRVAVDTDGDGSMENERLVASYRQQHETLQFKQETAEEKSPLTLAADIDGNAKTVSFQYDMGGHGTHVAGIATGYMINGVDGFNGVAPGAKVIAGKFSGDLADDNTVTGSMKRAYQYAAHLADSLAATHTPVVVNMSFGIGSSYEGDADIEVFLNQLLEKHPNLYIVTSAGNEGPGLSSTGIPASAARIISVGALLPQGIGRDSYSAWLDRDILWDFSSRGGEVDKPDVVAPGTAISTIARYAFDMRASGTSMASPYTAGVVALLLSAMRQEDSTWVPTQTLIRRVLRNSAVPLADYAPIEQGGGVVNVRRAYELLKKYRKSGFADDIQEYIISTYSPNYPNNTGPTAFWRSAYIPDKEWRQTFMINRAIAPPVSEDGSAQPEFFRAYTLESTAPWLSTVQKTVYIRNTSSAEVDVIYDREKMKEPGLYSARVKGYRATSKGKAAKDEVEFELVNTVIVPHRFTPDNGYQITTPAQKVYAGGIKRFYFAPPPDAIGMTFTLSVSKGSASNVSGSIIDRFGTTVNYLPRVKGKERSEGSNTVSLSGIGNGIIEAVVQADAFEGFGAESEFTLTANCIMLDLTPTTHNMGESSYELTVDAVNTGTEILEGALSYTVKGYSRLHHETMPGDTFQMPVTMYAVDGALWLGVEFSPEDYMKATDILVRLVDSSGYVQAVEPFNTPETWLFLPNFNREADSATYTLEVIFGSANYDDLPDIPITIEEKHVRPSDYLSINGYGGLELIPYIPQSYTVDIKAENVPAGYCAIGELRFKMKGADQTIDREFEIR